MTPRQVIMTVAAIFCVFLAVAFAGSVFQKMQDASVATSDSGFVPSTGQINNGD